MNSRTRLLLAALALLPAMPLPSLGAAAEERRNYPPLFEAAAAEFGVPADVLKGVAFAETRWTHLRWAPGDLAACNGMPRPYGIMSLWDNEHFGHSLVEAAEAIGESPEILKIDVRQNIRGAAALLRRHHQQEALPGAASRSDIESWRNAIAAYCGIPQKDLAQRHALDVFSFINRGYHRHGIQWPGQRVRLEPMRSAVDAIRRQARNTCAQADAQNGEAAIFQPAGQPDYPPAIWRPAYPGHWYTSGNGKRLVVIHDMEGYYLSTISYFQASNTQASAHYCINGLRDNASDAPAGEITQMVEERYYAWHARCLNTWSVGIEHEGFVSDPAWYTEEQYQASAALTRYLCDKYNISKDRNHIVGHGEWQNANWRAWMATNFPSIDPTCNNHTDPGANWAWNHYMQLVLDGGGPAVVAQPQNVVRNPGETASFGVVATGDLPLRYQWLRNGGMLAQATNASLLISNVQLSAAGSYSVWIRNASGAITSEVAYLNVNSPASPIGTGSGLLAAYFDQDDFSAPHFSRVDSTVNFDWGMSGPTVSMADDHFSVRWVGQVEPRYSQRYSFYVRSDDGSKLWVNGQVVIDQLNPQLVTEWKGEADLVAGQRYELRLDYFDRTGEAQAALSWSSASQVKQIISRTQLYPPAVSVRSPATLFSYEHPIARFAIEASDPDPGAGGILGGTDFEAFPDGSPNGTVLFRAPGYSGSTDRFLDGSTNYSTITDVFPAGHAGSRVLKTSWSFAPGLPAAWLRLTTAAAGQLPNPAVDLHQAIQLDLWTDRPLAAGLGIRETTNSVLPGENGGVLGPIEFVGVGETIDGTPQPVRSIAASNWVTLNFNLPKESVTAFTGDGALSTEGGAVLEHLALVPRDGAGRYTVYLDNVQVVKANTLSYALVDPPPGVTIDELGGMVQWVANDVEIPATNAVRVRISNQTFPPMVTETNLQLVILPWPKPTIRVVGDSSNLICELKWAAVAGSTYRIHFQEVVGVSPWKDAGLPVQAEGSEAVYREPIPIGTASRFYRVLPMSEQNGP